MLIEFLFSFLKFLIVLAIGVLLTKVFVDLIEKFLKRKDMLKLIKSMGYDERVIDLACMILRYSFYFITFIAAISQFGIAGMVLNFILIGIIIAFFAILIYYLRDFIPNAMACIWITRFKSIKKGCWVKVGRYEGKVLRITLLNTMIKDRQGKIIILPNSIFTKKVVVRW